MTYFGLKLGQHLEIRAARLHHEFPVIAPPPIGGVIEFLQNHKIELLHFYAMGRRDNENKRQQLICYSKIRFLVTVCSFHRLIFLHII